MRIIKYGTKKLKMQRFTCPYCESIFDAEPGEYKTNFTKGVQYNIITCPCCRLQVMQAEEE